LNVNFLVSSSISCLSFKCFRRASPDGNLAQLELTGHVSVF
jgi:hypothetical protein